MIKNQRLLAPTARCMETGSSCIDILSLIISKWVKYSDLKKIKFWWCGTAHKEECYQRQSDHTSCLNTYIHLNSATTFVC